RSALAERLVCPKCGCDDASMLEQVKGDRWFCNNCSHDWSASRRSAPAFAERRFTSLDELVARAGLRRDELVTLADIGALNAFGYDRRSALWQAERAIRPSGELFSEGAAAETAAIDEILAASPEPPAPTALARAANSEPSALTREL